MKNKMATVLKSYLKHAVLRRSNRALVRKVLFQWYKFRFFLGKPSNLKIHLGCGNIRKEGFLNIDHRVTRATNMLCDIRKLPFPLESVGFIECYHVIEHIPHPEVPDVLKEWYRILQSGGRLIIECPDFDRAVQEYMTGNESRLYNIFGLQRFPGDAHLFGYNRKRLFDLLSKAGFVEIVEAKPTDYHANQEPCLRVEGKKG
jgi:predicted SAM-dependent methyltransferase